MRRVLVLALLASGCGSAPLPPPAGPGGHAVAAPGVVASVDARGRRLVLRDARGVVASAPAGVGPTAVECRGGWCFVLDTQGHGLLVFRVRRLELVRRQYLLERPAAMRLEGRQLAISLVHGGVERFVADGRVRLLR